MSFFVVVVERVVGSVSKQFLHSSIYIYKRPASVNEKTRFDNILKLTYL